MGGGRGSPTLFQGYSVRKKKKCNLQLYAPKHRLSNMKWTPIVVGLLGVTATNIFGSSHLGRSVTPIFLLTNHFLSRFPKFCEKIEKAYYLLEVWNFCPTDNPTLLFWWALFLAVRLFKGLTFMNRMATSEIINATYPLRLNISVLTGNPGDLASFLRQFSNSGYQTNWSPLFLWRVNLT